MSVRDLRGDGGLGERSVGQEGGEGHDCHDVELWFGLKYKQLDGLYRHSADNLYCTAAYTSACTAAYRYKSPGEAYVEGDASSASYFLAGATITGGTVTVEGCGSDSLQVCALLCVCCLLCASVLLAVCLCSAGCVPLCAGGCVHLDSAKLIGSVGCYL